MKTGLSRIIAATAIGGTAAYLITWLVPRVTGFESYAVFAIFWGFLYFVVSALSGIQQEMTRSTRVIATASVRGRTNPLKFGTIAAMVVFAAVLGTSPLWVGAAFPGNGFALVWPIAVGAASYVVVAVVAGTLYGLAEWGSLFWLISIDAVLRVATVSIALLVNADIVVLSWAVVVPFPLAVLLLSPMLARRVLGRVELETGYRDATWNVLRTVLAAASMGVLVSGMPLVLGITSADVPPAEFGLVVITMTLTRAPLIVVVMALQSYLIVLFKAATRGFWTLYFRLTALILGGGGVLAGLGFILGPWVFSLLFPGEVVPSGGLIAIMVLSSAVVGLLCLSAPAVLSRGAHYAYAAGWLVAGISTFVLLVLPLPFVERTLLALCVGPACGLAVHVGYLATGRRSPAAEDLAE